MILKKGTDMIRFAVIGTNWISTAFVRAAHHTGKMRLYAVYSRRPETARDFGQTFDVSVYYTDLVALARDKMIDAVYIASPNALHCEQAILMMEHGKHVICEKPIASNVTEARKMDKVANRRKVVLFEAYRSGYLPNFARIRIGLEKIAPLRKAFFNYCQYSSRYQQYLDGLNPNTFNPVFANGSVMDIGFYGLAAAVSLFGRPELVKAEGQLLASGVDGEGSVLLRYPQLTVIVNHSKITDSALPSEIQGESGRLVIDHIADVPSLSIHYRNGRFEDLTVPQHENTMIYEADVFADALLKGQLPDRQRVLWTSALLTEIRQQIGIVYPGDHFPPSSFTSNDHCNTDI
jgi:predicted dehydrogenase